MKQRGFTLLELMVVIALIGIVTGLAVISLGSDPIRDRVSEEGKRLAALFNLHRDLAMLKLEQRGVVVTAQGYQFLRREGEDWQQLRDQNVAGSENLGDDITVALVVDESSARPENDDGQQAEDSDADPVPQIWIFSTGELSPFEITVSDLEQRYRFVVTGSAGGRLSTRTESRVE